MSVCIAELGISSTPCFNFLLSTLNFLLVLWVLKDHGVQVEFVLQILLEPLGIRAH